MIALATTEQSEYDPAFARRMTPLIAEFFGLTEREIWEKIELELQDPGSTVAKAWNAAIPRTASEVKRFYSQTSSYVFDLVVDHCHLRRRAPLEAIYARIERNGAARRVLMYGDGIGTDSISIARRGHRVTYFDLPGVTSAFASFRFKREDLPHPISVIQDENDFAPESFDAVVCIEVLEHVPDPPAVMKNLYRALKPGGIALVTESFESVGDEFPSHLPQNLQYAGRIHQLMEQLGFANTYYNTDPINRPMEFTKMRRGVSGEITKLKGKLRRAIASRLRRMGHLRANG